MAVNIACAFCGGGLESLWLVNDFPEAPRAAVDVRKERIDFNIGCCRDCHLVQQISSPRLNVLYEDFKNDVIGQKLDLQKTAFVKFLSSYVPPDGVLLEYGAGNCLVASNLAKSSSASRIIANDYNLEPIAAIDARVELIEGDFNDLKFGEKSIDVIYSSHVFEHLGEFFKHLTNAANFIKVGGKYIIALPYFERWLADFNLNVFTQEHPVYPFKDDLIFLFSKFGFEAVSFVEQEDHSLFCTFKNVGRDANIPRKSTKSKRTKVQNFVRYIESLKEQLKFLSCSDGRIVVFGANSSGQLLINFLEKGNVNATDVVDNSELKQGKILFGTDLQIQSPIIIKELNVNDIVLIFVGVYDDEIKKQVRNLNSEVRIYTKENFLNKLS